MSILETILYIVIGAATLTYVTVTIVKFFKKKKKSGEQENEDQTDATDM